MIKNIHLNLQSKKPPVYRFPAVFSLAIYLIIISLYSIGCEIKLGGRSSGTDDEVEKATPVYVQEVARDDISSHLRLNVTLEPDKDIYIYSRIVGNIIDLPTEEGRRVREGSILCQLDDAEQKLSFERTSAALAGKEVLFAKSEKLHQNNMLSKDELEQSRLALTEARIYHQQAALTLEYTSIRAPFSGIIAERLVDNGDRVDPSRPIFRLVDNSRMEAVGWISETDKNYLKKGAIASIELGSGADDENIYAKLIRISPIVDPSTGKIKVTFIIEGNTGALMTGQFIQLKLILETRQNTLVIPKKSIIYEAGIPVVYIVQDSTAFRRKIRLGLQTGSEAEVFDGLTESDLIIIEGQSTIQDSALVEILTS